MKQNLKKTLAISILSFFLFSAFVSVAQTEDDEFLDDLFGSSEEVTCDNVVDVFEEYTGLVKLLEDVFSKSLSNMSNVLDEIRVNGEILEKDLENQIEQIDEAKGIIDENKYQTLQRGEDILSVLQDCLARVKK